VSRLVAGRFRFPPLEEVSFGEPAAETVAALAARRGARRVFVLASGTLARTTGEIDRLREALGGRYAGLFDAMPAHSPRGAVIEAAAAARAAGADLLVSFGGGSVTDGCKVVQICLTHDIRDAAELDDYRIDTSTDGKVRIPEFGAPTVRQIAVPTTLSGGEFNPLAGCTDERRKVKEGYRHPALVPFAIVLDPAVTRATPEWLWLSTGVRALDHAVETICSVRANPYCDGTAIHAIRLLRQALPRVKADPGDLAARLDCQIAMWHSMTSVVGGVPMGASHAIGHILGGTCDVPHGYTSCVMLPAVMAWNASANAERQALVAEAFGEPGRPAADVLHRFIAGLGLPRRLSEVGVRPELFALIAENSLHDRWLHANPRKVQGVEDVVAILRQAA